MSQQDSTFPPVRLVGYGARDVSAVAAAVDWRAYERPLPEVAATLALHLGGAFYDVGANTGFYSVLLGRLHAPSTIVAFEPIPTIADLCRRNLELNRVSADLRQVAVSDSVGQATIHLPNAEHGLIETSASLNPDFKDDPQSTIGVATVTVDSVNAARHHELVGLIKIDVEGFEHAVLRGAHEVTTRHRAAITIELLDRADLGVVNDFMARHDYRIAPLRVAAHLQWGATAAFAPDGWNQVLAPAERIDELSTVIADPGPLVARLAEVLADRILVRDIEIDVLNADLAWLFEQSRLIRQPPSRLSAWTDALRRRGRRLWRSRT